MKISGEDSFATLPLGAAENEENRGPSREVEQRNPVDIAEENNSEESEN